MYEVELAEFLLELERGVAVTPGTKITIIHGDKLRVKATLSYRGPALSDAFYGAIGNKWPLVFDEIIRAEVPISFPLCYSWTVFELTVDIPITTAIAPGTGYDLYVKIKGHTEAGLPQVLDCIDVIGMEFKDFRITSYDRVAGA